MSRLSRPSRIVGAVAVIAASFAVAGCSVPDPKGEGPLRYRDDLFANVTVEPDQQYGEAPGVDGQPEQLRLDVYKPAGDTFAKRPVIIWMHGGSWRTGSRKDGSMVELSKRFARRGYVAISISYRLMATDRNCGGAGSVSFCSSAAIAGADDLRAAVRWTRRYATDLGIDPGRIAIGGASAGAISALLVGVSPALVGSSGNPGYSSAVRAVVSISGALPFDDMYEDVQGPVLLWHGSADTVVPFAWAESNNAWMQNNSGEFMIPHFVQGAGHTPFGQYMDDIDRQARNFLYPFLSLGGLNKAQAAATTPSATTP